MRTPESRRGAAPTLAIFVIFVIVSSSLVLIHLQSREESEVSEIQRLMASDVTQATSSSIEAELNNALYRIVETAMYDVGMESGTRGNVENRVIGYLNARIEEIWKYPNLEIEVPRATENSIKFEWQADGGVVVWGYLDSRIEHVVGPTAYGTFLHAAPPDRFQRLKYVSGLVAERVERVTAESIPELENELNENYECEGMEIDLTPEDSLIGISVMDTYGGKGVVLED